MKISYGTYATAMLPLDDSLRMISALGYDGVEITIGSEHHTLPETCSPVRRSRIRRLLEELQLGVPAFFLPDSVYTEDSSTHCANLELIRQVNEFARGVAPDWN